MTPKQYYKSHTKDEVERVAVLAGTTFANFQQMALYRGTVSPTLARRLAAASGGEMTLEEILFRSDYESAKTKKA